MEDLYDWCRWNDTQEILKILAKSNDIDVLYGKAERDGSFFTFAIKNSNIEVIKALLSYFEEKQFPLEKRQYADLDTQNQQDQQHNRDQYQLAKNKLVEVFDEAKDMYDISEEMQELFKPYLVNQLNNRSHIRNNELDLPIIIESDKYEDSLESISNQSQEGVHSQDNPCISTEAHDRETDIQSFLSEGHNANTNMKSSNNIIGHILLRAYGNQCFANNNFKEALEYYSNAIECYPKYHTAYRNLGNVHVKLEQELEAIKDYINALRYKPQNVQYEPVYTELIKLFEHNIQTHTKEIKQIISEYICTNNPRLKGIFDDIKNRIAQEQQHQSEEIQHYYIKPDYSTQHTDHVDHQDLSTQDTKEIIGDNQDNL